MSGTKNIRGREKTREKVIFYGLIIWLILGLILFLSALIYVLTPVQIASLSSTSSNGADTAIFLILLLFLLIGVVAPILLLLYMWKNERIRYEREGE